MKFKTKYKSEGTVIIAGILFQDGIAELNEADGKAAMFVLTEYNGCEVVDEPAAEAPAAVKESDTTLKAAATKAAK